MLWLIDQIPFSRISLKFQAPGKNSKETGSYLHYCIVLKKERESIYWQRIRLSLTNWLLIFHGIFSSFSFSLSLFFQTLIFKKFSASWSKTLARNDRKADGRFWEVWTELLNVYAKFSAVVVTLCVSAYVNLRKCRYWIASIARNWPFLSFSLFIL